jgi:transposase
MSKEAGMSDVTTTTERSKETVGLDVGDRFTQVCILDDDGEMLEEGRVPTTPRAFRQRFAAMPSARLVLEAGTHSLWASRLLSELGHEVVVANPRMLRFIYGNTSKNDRADAGYLARVGKLDPSLLHPIVHRSGESQAHLALLRSRDVLVRSRARLVGHARGLVKPFGFKLPHCSTTAFVKKAGEHIPEILAPALDPVLGIISALSERIQELEAKIETLARETYPDTAILAQVPGVGTLTSLAYVLTIEDPSRFPRARAVGSYLGLRPRQDESGAQKPQLHITKAGDEFLRHLLVECAHYMLSSRGADSDLKRWGLKLAERGGKAAKKRAVVAVARKLSVLLLRLWTTGEIYEPLRMATRRGDSVATSS